jgi:uncharacterized protein YycO
LIFVRRTTIIVIPVALAVAVAVGVLIYAVGITNKTSGNAQSNIQSVQSLVVAIQRQRVASILTSCRDQNMRNRETIRTLDQLIARLPAHQRARARASRQNTILIVNALAPYQDCKALAARRVPSFDGG